MFNKIYRNVDANGYETIDMSRNMTKVNGQVTVPLSTTNPKGVVLDYNGIPATTFKVDRSKITGDQDYSLGNNVVLNEVIVDDDVRMSDANLVVNRVNGQLKMEGGFVNDAGEQTKELVCVKNAERSRDGEVSFDISVPSGTDQVVDDIHVTLDADVFEGGVGEVDNETRVDIPIISNGQKMISSLMLDSSKSGLSKESSLLVNVPSNNEVLVNEPIIANGTVSVESLMKSDPVKDGISKSSTLSIQVPSHNETLIEKEIENNGTYVVGQLMTDSENYDGISKTSTIKVSVNDSSYNKIVISKVNGVALENFAKDVTMVARTLQPSKGLCYIQKIDSSREYFVYYYYNSNSEGQTIDIPDYNDVEGYYFLFEGRLPGEKDRSMCILEGENNEKIMRIINRRSEGDESNEKTVVCLSSDIFEFNFGNEMEP